MYIGFSEIFESFYICFDVLVAVCRSGFDCIADVDAFDTGDMKSGVLNFLFDSAYLVLCPEFARHLVHERCDYSFCIADLPDLFEGNGIVAFTVPTHCHFHVLVS